MKLFFLLLTTGVLLQACVKEGLPGPQGPTGPAGEPGTGGGGGGGQHEVITYFTAPGITLEWKFVEEANGRQLFYLTYPAVSASNDVFLLPDSMTAAIDNGIFAVYQVDANEYASTYTQLPYIYNYSGGDQYFFELDKQASTNQYQLMIKADVLAPYPPFPEYRPSRAFSQLKMVVAPRNRAGGFGGETL